VRSLLSLGVFLSFCMITAVPQTPTPRITPGKTPKEVVEQLWGMATQGLLLTDEGWSRSSGSFTKPDSAPRNREFRVVSNYYGVISASTSGNSAEVDMDYQAVGKIDSALRFTPAPKSQFVKTAIVYRLVLGPTPLRMFGPDGKMEEKMTGHVEWRIESPQDSPWTTVNTAIRYVLEMRDKTTDPDIKKNATQTLAALLHYH
jgi:hypothetical protein